MSCWTHWRKIADRHGWDSDLLDWDGPACYELAIAGPRGGTLEIVYVGETSNEMRGLVAYAQHGSHLSEIIHWHLARGWHLYYRAQGHRSKRSAIAMQDNLLARWDYDWNLRP
jgi:hypothetical protein